MATVSKTLSGGGQAPTLKLMVTVQSQSVENNRSTLAYTFTIERPSSVSSSAQKSYSINIGSQLITGSTTIGGSGTKTIKTGTVTINHSQDGSKTINYGFSMDVEITWAGTYNGTVENYANYELPTIPRATQPSLNVSEAFIGDTVTISMQRASSNFTHNLKIQIGSAVIQIGTGYGVSAQYTLPTSLINYITQSTSYDCLVWCETYQGTTHVGSKSTSLLVKIPTNVIPSITAVNLTEKNTAVTLGEYVQGYSKLGVSVSAQGVYGSTIKLITAELDGTSYQGATFDTDTLLFSGQQNLVVKAKDSRGRTVTYNKTVNVLAYHAPEIEIFKTERCDSDGTLNDSGTYAKITYKFDISSLNSKNAKTVKIEYKSGTSWVTLYTLSSYTADTSVVTSQTFTTDSSFEFRMIATDSFNEATAYSQIETDKVTFDIHSSGQGMSFGKVAEQADLFDVNWIAKFRKGIEVETAIEPTLLNGWANFNTDTYQGASYYKDPFGLVHLSGMVSGGTVTAGTGLFTLNEGYRPAKTEIFLCITANGYGSIRIDKNGTVVLRSGADATWTSLSGIVFKGV